MLNYGAFVTCTEVEADPRVVLEAPFGCESQTTAPR